MDKKELREQIDKIVEYAMFGNHGYLRAEQTICVDRILALLPQGKTCKWTEHSEDFGQGGVCRWHSTECGIEKTYLKVNNDGRDINYCLKCSGRII